MTELFAELARASRAAWDEYRARFPAERAYAFGLYVVSEDGLIVGSAYATEEATSRRAEDYAFVLDCDLAARARIVRWWDSDWPHCNDLRSLFDRVNAAIARAPVHRDVYTEALATIDRAVFGDVVLGVFGGEREAIDRSIARLNPPELVARYRAEVAAADAGYASLSSRETGA